jgi:hypothetical protein
MRRHVLKLTTCIQALFHVPNGRNSGGNQQCESEGDSRITSGWPVIRPESMAIAGITSCKPTRTKPMARARYKKRACLGAKRSATVRPSRARRFPGSLHCAGAKANRLELSRTNN